MQVPPYTSADKTIAADGFFYVYQGEGKPEVKMTFMSLMIELGLYSLQNSRAAFNSQFQRAQEKVACMEELNELLQQANAIKSTYDAEAKGDATTEAGDFFTKLAEFNRKYPGQAVAYNLDEIAVGTVDTTALGEQIGAHGKAKNEYEALREEYQTYIYNDWLADGDHGAARTKDFKQRLAEINAKLEAGGLSGPETSHLNLLKRVLELRLDGKDLPGHDLTAMEALRDGAEKSRDAEETAQNNLTNHLADYEKEYALFKEEGKTLEEWKDFLSNSAGKNAYKTFGSGEYFISNQGLQSLLSNMQTAQSTLSSENEQQSMRTNQAMNRSSGFLQQLQNMVQAAKESLQAASRAGGA
jgi:hypothetical protein